MFQVVMGQSARVSEDQRSPSNATSPSTEKSAQISLDSLLAEAAAYSDKDSNQSLEAKAQRALECPCIADLRSGPCGVQFSEAFLCFLKSTAEEKGSDCVHPFVALQKCIKTNPDAFPKGVLQEDEGVKRDEKPSPNYRIRPPRWSGRSKTPTH